MRTLFLLLALSLEGSAHALPLKRTKLHRISGTAQPLGLPDGRTLEEVAVTSLDDFEKQVLANAPMELRGWEKTVTADGIFFQLLGDAGAKTKKFVAVRVQKADTGRVFLLVSNQAPPGTFPGQEKAANPHGFGLSRFKVFAKLLKKTESKEQLFSFFHSKLVEFKEVLTKELSQTSCVFAQSFQRHFPDWTSTNLPLADKKSCLLQLSPPANLKKPRPKVQVYVYPTSPDTFCGLLEMGKVKISHCEFRSQDWGLGSQVTRPLIEREVKKLEEEDVDFSVFKEEFRKLANHLCKGKTSPFFTIDASTRMAARNQKKPNDCVLANSDIYLTEYSLGGVVQQKYFFISLNGEFTISETLLPQPMDKAVEGLKRVVNKFVENSMKADSQIKKAGRTVTFDLVAFRDFLKGLEFQKVAPPPNVGSAYRYANREHYMTQSYQIRWDVILDITPDEVLIYTTRRGVKIADRKSIGGYLRSMVGSEKKDLKFNDELRFVVYRQNSYDQLPQIKEEIKRWAEEHKS